MIDAKQCCGCGGCEQICPQNCISMVHNAEKFFVPKVLLEQCIDCNLCSKVCPMSMEPKAQPKECYCLVSKNQTVLANSSSGGAFHAIANSWCQGEEIAIYGSVLDKGQVRHERVTTLSDITVFQGSKYVQSDTRRCYSAVKRDLQTNKRVLFTGCPCQVAGLLLFLGKDYDNLLTMDFVCHGVPSQHAFDAYLKDVTESCGKKVREYRFRSPHTFFGKKDPLAVNVVFDDGTEVKTFSFVDVYMHSYLKGLMNRSCCYECNFAGEQRVADFTVGDFWGIEKLSSKLDVSKGASLLLANTQKAVDILEFTKNTACLEMHTIKEAVRYNKQLVRPFIKPIERDRFVSELSSKPFSMVARSYVSPGSPWLFRIDGLFTDNIKETIKKLLRRNS